MVFGLLGFFSAARAQANTEFVEAAVHRYGKEQLDFLQGFVASKKSAKDAPAKSLVSSLMAAQTNDVRPPLDYSALSKDADLSGALLLDYVDALYAAEQFELADGVLGLVPASSKLASEGRFSLLKLKLALRGRGPLGRSQVSEGTNPELALNQVLAALRQGDRSSAINQLKKLIDDGTLPASLRHRAAIWLAAVLGQQGQPQNALPVLDNLDGGSPLLAEGLLSILRSSHDLDPSAVSAIERQLASVIPESSARWEARDYLIRSLVAKGATAQASEQALAAIATLDATIGSLDKLMTNVRSMPVNDLAPILDRLPEGVRARGNEIIKRESKLRLAVDVLRAWRPHLDAYQSRLQRNPGQFAAEIRSAADGVKEQLQRESKDPNASANLFRLELSSLIGAPPNRDMAYGLFFGFAQWEFAYEYPESWRPSFDRPSDEDSGKRRRPRGPVAGRGQSDQQLLPMVSEHVGKLRAKVDTMLGKQSSIVFKGMAERAKELSARNLAQVKEIEKVLPLMAEAVRAEAVAGLKDRRRVAQQWLSRFAGQAVSIYVAHKATGEQPHFDLARPLAAKSGQALSRSLQATTGPVGKKVSREINIQPVWLQLQTLAATGDNRLLRADALRLRARLTLALYESQAIPSAIEAVEIYRSLLRDYGDLIDREETVYQLARAQDLAQRIDESLATLTQFAKEFPESARSGEVWFRIGEVQFSQGEFPLAKAAYESAIRRGETKYRDQAEYKLAWSLFKMGEHRDALPRFLSVLDRAAQSQGAGDGRQQERLKDTFRAVALTFANLNGAPEVERYFARVGSRPYVPDIYHSIARYYLEHERINDAADAYAYLVRQASQDARAPFLLADVISGARKERLNTLALELQERYIETYAVSGSYWSQADTGVRSQINERMQPFLTELAQMYHADAQQSRTASSYAKAIRYYGQYVATFPKDPQTPRFHFLMAEARFESGDYLAAMPDYDRAAYLYGAHPDAAASGYAALVASQKIAELAASPDERKVKVRELVDASGRFASTFPSDVRVDPVLGKAAEDMLMLGEPGDAVAVAEKLLARKPQDSVRRRAWIVVSHGAFENKDFIKAEGAYQQALAESGNSPEEQVALRARLALSVYRQAEAFRAAEKNELAIDTFLRVGRVAPGTEPVPNAEIDAAVLLMKIGQWARTIQVLENFQRTFAQHPLAAGVPTRLAHVYEQDGQVLKAADMLESISLGEADDVLARQMVWRAGELREKGERIDLATATYERYLIRYPLPLEKASEVRQQLAAVALKAGDVPTRDRWLGELVNHARDVEEAGPRVRFLGAQAALTLGDGRAGEFEAIALKLPLDKSLAAKRTAMEQALAWYSEAGRFGVAEVTTAATFKTAELYRQLAKDVLASDRPDGLSELEAGQYNVLLEEEAFPFEEKSAEIHVLNHQRIRSGIYDHWVEMSIASLQKLNPAKYDKVELTDGHFHYELPKPVTKEGGQSVAPPAAEGKPVLDIAVEPKPEPEAKPIDQGAANAASPR